MLTRKTILLCTIILAMLAGHTSFLMAKNRPGKEKSESALRAYKEYRTARKYAKKLNHNTSKQLKYAARNEHRFAKSDTPPPPKKFTDIYQEHLGNMHLMDSLHNMAWKTKAPKKQNRINKYKRLTQIEQGRISMCLDTEKQATARRVKLLKKVNMKERGQSKSYKKIDKKAFYSKVSNRHARGSFLKKGGGSGADKYLAQAREEQGALTKAVNKGGIDAIRSKMQVKKDVYKAMPQGKPGASTQTKTAANDNMQKSIQKFSVMRNGAIDPENIKDTITFKPNPHRGKPFIKRIKPGFNWQFQQPYIKTPGLLDAGITLNFLLDEKTSPFTGFSHRLGIGLQNDDVRLTHQGYTIRNGVEYLFKAPFGTFLSHEYAWMLNNDKESRDKYNTAHALIIGLMHKSGNKKRSLKMMLGYNMLYHTHRTTQSPIMFRIGIQ